MKDVKKIINKILKNKKMLGIVVGGLLAVILIISGGLLILWVVDFILVLFNKKIWWID